MNKQKKLSVSHAPFWHNNSGIPELNYNIILAALPAMLVGLINYGMPALGVISLAVSSAIIWEVAFNHLTKHPITAGDGNAALIGLLMGMLLPASAPWWLVIVGTFIAVVIGVQIFGGIGSNPFNPVALSIAILMVSWKDFLDLDEALIYFSLDFISCTNPLATLKHFGPAAVENLSNFNLLLGNQVGTIGSASGLAILLGGVYLIVRGIIRWEISFSFLFAVFLTSLIFNIVDPSKYANPMFHLLTGFTMIGAFFLATDNSSSPVNLLPMLLYGSFAGIMTVLIRNIGLYVDGVIFAILIANLANPIIDKIRPKAIGKVKVV